MKRALLLTAALLAVCLVRAQVDSAKAVPDTTAKLNMDAVYTRPFQQLGGGAVALGGYVEANSRYEGTDGVSEGLSFQLPRLTVFISSAITRRIKFLTEIELEEGGREINIEFASVDVALHPLLNLRGGVVMNPIGAFNQNHDGPKWEFIDRPIASTTIIPSTWSNVGFGLYGRMAQGPWVWGYEAYLTNGFDDRIVANPEGRTWLPASKENPERFEESSNGVPLVTLKAAVKYRRIGELGVSWMGGVYNRFEEDGLSLDRRRRVDLFALDYNTRIGRNGPAIAAEHVWAWVDVPSTYTQQYGGMQQGGFIDVVHTVLRRQVFGWPEARMNVAVRAEYADYNVGTFRETGGNIADDVMAFTGGIGFRPVPGSVFRANYGYRWAHDLLGNPPSRTGVVTFGISSYF
ncbi:MAG TPA: hypothetical protein VHL57_00825 [Flavobacteriales bacterium]|jgi:hypothetical protein|nr:hypothetical protein [Flavobacteriales bacterium]